ncbi:hypothetical protein [Streptomyces abyssomicinicus]|uniref:hypothetical protein n=1 Tax=Streptomyces abyssomicinicus TaxID=574929 RepID=UPI001250C0BF|nr:hypothetical protein [Streptomyces abyssomicinicus]
MHHADVPPPPVPAAEGWTLRPDGPGVWTATRSDGSGEPSVRVELARVLGLPLRHAYPVGARDLAVRTDGDRATCAALLPPLTAALFAGDPDCRRVLAAPALEDADAVARYRDGGFRLVAEADLPGGPVALMVAEPPDVAGIPTALDDMPH